MEEQDMVVGVVVGFVVVVFDTYVAGVLVSVLTRNEVDSIQPGIAF